MYNESHNKRILEDLQNRLDLNTYTNEIPQIWAMNIDFGKTNSLKSCVEITVHLAKALGVDIKFVIERKKKNNHYHLHSYFFNDRARISKKQLDQTIIYWLKGYSFKNKPVYDLMGWENYLLKENEKIHCTSVATRKQN